MLNHDYVAQSLRRPLPTKDGGVLRTSDPFGIALFDSFWIWRTLPRSAAKLELALFYDRQLNLKKTTSVSTASLCKW